MNRKISELRSAKPGDILFGFRIEKKEHVESKSGELYTLRHEKTGAELLYFDRADENKTFCISFKTLPEDNTGVFHILEHSVLNGSRKFPVKEPFVSMLQSSMQTFLNAMTYSDKTVYPVSSRNERDLFNLMSVYLDAVFCPLIYERPEIFMQEGWHYEFESDAGEPYYNGVVYSEMKGAYAEVDSIIDDEVNRLLFPDNSYGYVSGGHPEHITELSYRQFIDTHKRFYHPSNAKIFLDGHMDIDTALEYIDGEYLSKYEYKKPDFDFKAQEPRKAERIVFYEAREGEETLAHIAAAKILCNYSDTEKIYAAKILADYLTGSNEAPLKRAFLERGLARDVSLMVEDGIFQPAIALIVRNTEESKFGEVKKLMTSAVKEILDKGINKEALSASLEREVFVNREIREPYGLELAVRALDSWLYSGDPLNHIDNGKIFESLREKLNTEYFEDLLREMLGGPEDRSYLYLLPSRTKVRDDAEREAERLRTVTSLWSADDRKREFDRFIKMQEWQQSTDGAEVLSTLPHLDLKDVPEEVRLPENEITEVGGVRVLKVGAETGGIVYLDLFFDISDFSEEELKMTSVLASCFGELGTKNYPADVLQSKIKTLMGSLYAKIELTAKPSEPESCKPYLEISAAMLEENAHEAMELIGELLLQGRYDETDRICEIVMQNDYFQKQALIGDGHIFAMAKSLSAFSKKGAMKEMLEGESYIRWFSFFAEKFASEGESFARSFEKLAQRAFAGNRLFMGYGGELSRSDVRTLVDALPKNEMGTAAELPAFDKNDCAVEIPADVGFSALGHNLYALGGEFTGACSVLSSLMTYGYLWNVIRVQGGAYGTGMGVRTNGDIFCYSYRDPDLKNTREAYKGMTDFLDDFLSREIPLDDTIISVVNTTDPLLSPSGVCELECVRYLDGVTAGDVMKRRREILRTTPNDLIKLKKLLEAFIAGGKFCAIGSKSAVSFVDGR